MNVCSLVKYIGVVWILCIVFLIAGCDRSKEEGQEDYSSTMLHSNIKNRQTIRQDLLYLTTKKILFGHHSVGANIIEGMRDIAQQESISFNIIPISTIDSLYTKAGFYHFSPGKNGDPKTKVDGFVNFLTTDNDKKYDIAFMKFCFADIIPGSNVEEIFSYYKRNIEKLQQRYPNIQFIHCTVPLTTRSVSIKDRVKRFFGLRVWGDEANRLRGKYNALVRTFPKGTVFDLAKIESTRPDGRRCGILNHGKKLFSLFPGYTNDGGHLNILGRRIVAAAMIEFLSNVQANIILKSI